MRISKVRRTDFRGAGAPSPVGRGNSSPRAAASAGGPWEVYAANAAKEAAAHDRAVDGHSEAVLVAMARDLGGRQASERRDPEQRWVMGRKAAVLRKLVGMRGALR